MNTADDNDVTTATEPVPLYFTVGNVVALLWNLLGLLAFFGFVATISSEETLAQLPQEQRTLYETQPTWVTIAFAVAVFGGTLGCLGLVLRKSWAFPVLVLSLVGLLGQHAYMFLLSDTIEVMGGVSAAILPLMILVIAVALLPWTRMGIARGWLK